MSESAPSDGGRRSARERVRAALGTFVLCGVCVSAFAATVGHCVFTGGGADALVESTWTMARCDASLEGAGALALGRVWVDGQWWRVSSTGLLHGSWVHLILNIWSLLVVGPWVERAWGTVRMLLIFALSSVLGCIASVAWAEAPVVVGASAGILGLAGALFVGRRFGSEKVQEELAPVSARNLGWAIAAMVGLGFVVPMIAQAGHLGGLAGGLVLGFAWNRGKARGGQWGVPAVAGLIAIGVQLGRAPQYRPNYFEFSGHRLLELDRTQEAAQMFEAALGRAPDDVALKNAVAYAYARSGIRLEVAQELVQEALAEEPENPDFVDTLGWVQCRRGDTEAGLKTLRRASDLSGGEEDEIEGHLRDCASAEP